MGIVRMFLRTIAFSGDGRGEPPSHRRVLSNHASDSLTSVDDEGVYLLAVGEGRLPHCFREVETRGYRWPSNPRAGQPSRTP